MEKWDALVGGGGKSRIRSLVETGIPFALGSDGAMNPFFNIMLASSS
jgi:hypothetical protein